MTMRNTGWMERIRLLSRGTVQEGLHPRAGRRLITIPLLRRNCHYLRTQPLLTTRQQRQHRHYHRRNRRRRRRHYYHRRYPAVTITDG